MHGSVPAGDIDVLRHVGHRRLPDSSACSVWASQPGTRVASRTAYSQAKESSRLSDIFALCLLTFTSACCQIGTGAVNLERSS